MSVLTVFSDTRPRQPEVIRDAAAMAERLNSIGVRFERWEAAEDLPEDADQDAVLEAYGDPVDRLKAEYGFQAADVISVAPDHPDKAAMRQKFLAEHIHSDFEVRFFVAGRGLFFLHPDDNVYAVLCEKGDLISVPANMKHWFDMGADPQLSCIRLFTTPEGWVAQFTGNEIAAGFPTLEQFRSEYRA
jgi:1,2-dihydroxy-3-keto-5-methylthiopentene dioxygenase